MTIHPQTIHRYQIRATLGIGGMSTVYRAFDPQFQREVAIKVLPRELLHKEEFLTRFRREITTITTLEHPAIVPVYDFGEAEGQPYLVMRLMSGGSLKDRLEKGPLSLDEIARLFSRLAPALDYAHQQGVIHRDLKPGNVLFDKHGEPHLADFGIVRLVGTTNTLTGEGFVGTPAYMSPEQGRGQKDIDHRGDIYALGAMLFEMLTGRVPYESDTPTGQIIQHITEPIPNVLSLRPTLPKDCQRIVARAMAKQPYDRYATVGELSAALGAVASGKPLPKPRPTKPRPTLMPPPPDGGGTHPTRRSTPRPGNAPLDSTRLTIARSTIARVVPARFITALPSWGWVALGLVFLALVGFALNGLFFTPAQLYPTPSPSLTESPEPTLQTPSPVLTPAIESSPPPSTSTPFPSGFATALLVQGVVQFQTAGQGKQLAEQGDSIPEGPETVIWTTSAILAELKLSDGSRVFLDGNATVSLISVAGSSVETIVNLAQGKMLVEADGLTVQTKQAAFHAQVTEGWMGVDYESIAGQFLVDCLSGACRVGVGGLTGGQRNGFYNSVLGKPVNAQYPSWIALGGPDVPTPTPTPTPTETPTSTPRPPTVPPTSVPTKTPEEEEEPTPLPTIPPLPTP